MEGVGEPQLATNPPATTSKTTSMLKPTTPKGKRVRVLSPRMEEAFTSIAIWKMGGDEDSNENYNSVYNDVGFQGAD